MSVLLKPYAHRAHGRGIAPAASTWPTASRSSSSCRPQSVDVIVTSPPYNLGIRYNRYQDTLSPAEYLEWTDAWVAAAARVLRPDGSLFLNVGARPTDPWTALDVAQAVRPHLRLQNIIHWIKSIAIDRESAGAAAGLDARPGGRPLQADQQRPVPERLPRVHLSLHARGRHAARSARARRAVSGPVEHRAGGGPRPTASAAAATPGSSPTRRSSAATGIGRTRRPSRHGCPSSACGCTACRGSRLAMDPFTGLGSTAVACARLGVDFIGAEIDEAYLKEAVERTRRRRDRAHDAASPRATERRGCEKAGLQQA